MRRVVLGATLLGCCLMCAASVGAAPDLWVEAHLEPASVSVNVQSTFVLRFGHAVDVRRPELAAPVHRLAEVRPLGGVVSSEQTRGSKRYRVLERRFAVLPFASGALSLQAEVTGNTPAAIPQAGAGGRIALASPPLALQVTAADARPGVDWLPAHTLRISASGKEPARFAAGEVWERHILIEAEGIDGSVIPPLRLPVSDDWLFQSAGGEVGLREVSGRLIGYRRQVVYAQARNAGSLVFPALAVDWWGVSGRAWTQTVLPATNITVAAGRTPAPHVGPPPAIASARWSPWSSMTAAALLLLGSLGLATRTRWRAGWERWQRRRALNAACHAGDAVAAQRALLAWASAQGVQAGTLEAVARWAHHRGNARLATAIGGLETACYGRRPGGWDGSKLRRAIGRGGYNRGNKGQGSLGAG